ncbi:ATP-binding cassette domain-containing protein [Rhodococcus sp. BP-252]|uniref:ABC transporter ATP-binding protein n=1 Tax=unclassified Rhodococcus (in: high G+C Gram-positive bacteria) TaxID=192944 RepID=UPI001C9AC209|nr:MULTISPECIES: ABC transporter ATP-binding protein [unclassified Rhodococcus (in: high G+C Gram-positive bacteria)]MBY6412275.1 ATP-binding cassette domain-containing protein [Rhodococcus sp. BP-320]MBY6416855.1 ATP-binding cassette domain-containing protein [Rhodococcus sp. BP-321]MBY6421607.1 ATP-binding cassette domain-containing protein [Rhodococcus sp. BP-324]MBY6426873.1 ATP-binding cassette domain-containing protein [Rhodococcus sp. BP-323]MBY6432039.1 ATP-binding cassette domain-cont
MTDTERTVTGASIRLDGVVKQYRGQAKPAVQKIDLEIEAGHIVAFVGPSGCGKTTTLKMINRLIEPTEGRLFIGDRDVTGEDPDKLRQSIGYVIQAGGLFPHWSVSKNIGAIPRVLGWDKKRIAERTEYLLDLVGLDADTFRDRLPKDMSGGQQQRVGVARALAADPPVLLMDEPFSAVDPITRVRLQDSLIAIQHEVAKTIVIVTHDFEEATKLGDKVLILSEGGKIEQYASPEEILARPATPFVEEFIGSGATLAHLTLSRVKDVDHEPVVTARVGDDSHEVIARAKAAGVTWIVVVDADGRPRSWPSLDEVATKDRISDYVDNRLPTVAPSSTLNDALDTMLAASQGGVLVTDGRGAVTGSLTIATVMAVIRSQLSDAREGDGHVSYTAHGESPSA